MELLSLKNEVFDYLENTIKNTPQNFKDLIDAIMSFKEKCDINLCIYAGLEFNPWGDFRGGSIRIGEGYANVGERILIDIEDIEHFQMHDNVTDYIYDFLCNNYQVFNEDDDNYDGKLSEDLYEELDELVKKDEKFVEHEKNYLYMRMAERMKTRFEVILVESGLADKVEEIHPLNVYHNKKLIISFGVKYNID